MKVSKVWFVRFQIAPIAMRAWCYSAGIWGTQNMVCLVMMMIAIAKLFMVQSSVVRVNSLYWQLLWYCYLLLLTKIEYGTNDKPRLFMIFVSVFKLRLCSFRALFCTVKLYIVNYTGFILFGGVLLKWYLMIVLWHIF